MSLNDDDLIKNHNYYSVQELEKNIHSLNKKILLSTQILDAEFCIKYILDMDIDNGSEDSYIFDFDYILSFQKHLSNDELKNFFDIYKKYQQ
tara:strand:+ start:12954 stop:13229 length:276 start_codon:yes stop_codon:yes gene_type:complete